MAEFLEDPSVLTKDKLKNELTANNVTLPSGEHKKEVYVQLYLKNLTVLNSKRSPPPDTFSSDDDMPAPLVSSRSRSGRKATRKTDKPPTEVEVTDLTDEDLKEQLAKHGVDAGPIVATTRKLYEKKLEKILDQPPAEAPSVPEKATEITAVPEADSNQNGNTQSDQYSDKEDEEIAAPEPEPIPVVEKPVRSRGKTPVTVRTSSRRQAKAVEENLASGDQTPKKTGESVVEDILANEISTPAGISATCRRPIRGAAGRPLQPSEYWLDESRVQRSVRTETRFYSESVSRVSNMASSTKPPARRGLMSLLLRLLLLIAVVASFYYVYHNLDAERISALKGLLDSAVVPLQSLVDSTVTYLGIGGGSSAEGSSGK
ncbi:thymopoietin b [Lampris incognitus]|uniref:thymopoietin b n=1 Tax=Lampris incognitus TaxID=2546036 RepID=UPI0024B4E20C|nr:thymopoietin b [Lampris incognitus]